jgi:hypothetical protein
MRGTVLSLRTFKGHEEEEDDPWSQEGSDDNGKNNVPLHRDNNVVTLTLDLGGDDDRRSKIWSRYFIQIEILYGVHRNSNDYGESTSGQSTNFRFIRLTELIFD